MKKYKTMFLKFVSHHKNVISSYSLCFGVKSFFIVQKTRHFFCEDDEKILEISSEQLSIYFFKRNVCFVS